MCANVLDPRCKNNSLMYNFRKERSITNCLPMFSVLLPTVAFSLVHYHAQVQILDNDLSVLLCPNKL